MKTNIIRIAAAIILAASLSACAVYVPGGHGPWHHCGYYDRFCR